MKKINLYIILFLFCAMFFCGCNNLLNPKKPFKFYYANLLAKNLVLENYCKCSIMDMNYYKEKNLSNSDIIIIKNFIKALRKGNYINEPRTPPSKPKYKIIINFKKDKFIIDVYNDKLITIYPWDGNYEKDYISMENIYDSYNLYNFCSYFVPKD